VLLLVRLFAAGLRAVERRAVVPDFFAAAGFAAPVVREADAALAFVAVERLAAGLRRFAAAVDVEAEVDVELVELSIENLPDITRCAASATASAMSEPSLVALDITDFAALSAVSAASIPASLIALRAFGLALIAAAAAASPAASISLLIAAFASLSVVLLLDPFERDEEREDEDLEEPFRVLDFAICKSPLRSPHLHLA